MRRVERELIGEYRELIVRSLESLSPASHASAIEIAELPDLVRGYESIKLANVARFRERAAALLAPKSSAVPLGRAEHR